MLRGVTKRENAIALAIEAALPFSTSAQTGWREVTPERKAMCVAAARAAIAATPQQDNPAVVARRKSAKEAADFYATPPWGTRALVHHVLPRLDIDLAGETIEEPCCGEGHMAGVLEEFTGCPVRASDILDYGYGTSGIDYLHPLAPLGEPPDWTITNPPFTTALEIALRAVTRSQVGAALLLRTQWVEGEERYNKLFRHRPPTLIAHFVERLPMVAGRWDPDAKTATSYSWFVWERGRPPLPPFWIPPGCRTRLERADDRRRWGRTAEAGPGQLPLLDQAEA
jgi:hypothetical protein